MDAIHINPINHYINHPINYPINHIHIINNNNIYINFNGAFKDTCIVCLNTTILRHYYECDIPPGVSHHGMCQDCFIKWCNISTNTCPMCRSSCSNNNMIKYANSG